MYNFKVCAVVVTYNRKEYLMNTIKGLLSQSLELSAILIFDNCSNDGTQKELYNRGFTTNDSRCEELTKVNKGGIEIYYFKNSCNSGGSGGFNKAIEIGLTLGHDYLWCMDDDVLPDEACLLELSKYISGDTMICIPSRTDEHYKDHAIVGFDLSNPFKYSIDKRKKYLYNEEIFADAIDVVDMPFEGPLIKCEVIEKIGLPNKDLFIIFDDTEFAYRALKYTKIKYVKKAVLHKQIIPHKDGKQLMGWKDYYGYRNQIWFDRKYGDNKLVKLLRPRLLIADLVLRAVIKRKWSNIKVLRKAYSDGMSSRLGKLVEPGTKGEDFT